jgi:hypothetical protein
MTIPAERYYSLLKTREFLKDLLDPKKTPRVPRAIRSQAYWCLRHYPWDIHLEMIPQRVPEHFEEERKK